MQPGLSLIIQERDRQIQQEGFSVRRDVEAYTADQLAWAAVHYAAPSPAFKQDSDGSYKDVYPDTWLGNKKKEQPRLRQLVIAGALMAAEIDRIVAAQGTSRIGGVCDDERTDPEQAKLVEWVYKVALQGGPFDSQWVLLEKGFFDVIFLLCKEGPQGGVFRKPFGKEAFAMYQFEGASGSYKFYAMVVRSRVEEGS